MKVCPCCLWLISLWKFVHVACGLLAYGLNHAIALKCLQIPQNMPNSTFFVIFFIRYNKYSYNAMFCLARIESFRHAYKKKSVVMLILDGQLLTWLQANCLQRKCYILAVTWELASTYACSTCALDIHIRQIPYNC